MADRRARIAVISMGVKLGNEEKGYTRFLSLSEQLAAAGFEVELITSSFQHWEKRQRSLDDAAYRAYPFKLTFIEEPGYQRNIDLRRLLSHRVAARELMDHLKANGPFDLIYCEIPPNDVARRASEYARAQGLPFIVDVNDLWPQAMRMVLDLPLLSTILFYPFARDARKTYQNATAIVGTSDEYARHPFDYRVDDIEHITVYVGNELARFDDFVRVYAPTIDKPAGEFWVTYAGTLGASYDIETMLRASAELGRRGYGSIKTLILGAGPDQARLEALARDLGGNTAFGGYLDYPQMAAWLACSDVLVNSLVKKAPQSIVNKIADYLAAGKPMVNTGENPELKALVADEGIGVNVQAGDAQALADVLATLFCDPEGRKQMGAAARRLAAARFDRATAYQQILALITRQLS
jgi:glycosyltransferase involved in cell wall biosynthesis